MAYDSRRGVTVLFGGSNTTALRDTWEWNGKLWQHVADNGPPAGYMGCMVYDSDRGVCVLYDAWNRRTWEWNGIAWAQVASSGPSQRLGHAMAYDATRKATVLFGGNVWLGYNVYYADTWTWNGSVWSQITATGPAGRQEAVMAFDRDRNVTMLHGGNRGGNNQLRDTWEWNGSAWTNVDSAGPGTGGCGSIAYDAVRHVMVLFASPHTQSPAGTYEWGGTAWVPVYPPETPAYTLYWRNARNNMVYDNTCERMVLFGGFDQAYLADTWEYGSHLLKITQQPQSRRVCEGWRVTLTVEATGTPPLYYQWRKDGVVLADNGNISGSGTDMLMLNPASFGDAGDYDVVVSDSCSSLTSVAATLRLNLAHFWNVQSVDPAGGYQASLAVLSDGQPALSYTCGTLGAPQQMLKYAWRDGGSWQFTNVGTVGDANSPSSLAVLPSGQPAIVYSDSTDSSWTNGGRISAIKCAQRVAGQWQITTITTAGLHGHHSLVILPSGQPAVVFCDPVQRDLEYAWFDGNGWQTETVESQGDVGLYPNLAVLQSGQPAVAYLDYTQYSNTHVLRYAWRDNTGWHPAPVINALPWACYGILGVGVVSSGAPVISYRRDGWVDGRWNPDLGYAWNDGQAWHVTTVDVGGELAYTTSVAMSNEGFPAIVYSQSSSAAQFAKCARETSYGWELTVLGPWYSHEAAFLPSGIAVTAFSDQDGLEFATPQPVTSAPVQIDADFTAETHSTLTEVWQQATNEAVYDEPFMQGYGDSNDANGYLYANLEITEGGHLRGVVTLSGQNGEVCFEETCMEWADTGECLYWDCMTREVLSFGSATGTITGTFILGTSEPYPMGTPLSLRAEVRKSGSFGTGLDYSLRLLRAGTVVGEVTPSTAAVATVSAFAGETLAFEAIAMEATSSVGWGNDRFNSMFEFRVVIEAAGYVGPDFDRDGDVDETDFSHFQLCGTGSTVPQSSPNCANVRLDADEDVDQDDFGIFQRCYSGTNKPADPNCAN